MPSNMALSLHFFIQLAVTLAACWGLGLLLRRLGQPQVVADMVAGFVLGPTLLGLVLPAAQRWLFPATITMGTEGGGTQVTHPSLVVVYVLGQLGLVLYMFVVGLSFDSGVLREHGRSAAASSAAGVTAPVVAGGLLGWQLAGSGSFFGPEVGPWRAALFVGAAMAITAFPMLARIIHENGLTGSPTGTVALACAAVDDTVAWILLALVVATAMHDPSVAALAIGGALVYVLVVLTVGRRLFARLGQWAVAREERETPALVVTLVILLACASFTEAVGVYAVVGAFLCGVAMPRGAFNQALRNQILPLTVRALLPLFFIFSGLNTHFDLLLDPVILGVLLLTVVVATASKGTACTLAARSTGLPWREAASLGALMNARGLMELILLNIGLEKGLVTPALYTVLALMTVVTTVASTPLYFLVQRLWSQKPVEPDRTGHIHDEPVGSR